MTQAEENPIRADREGPVLWLTLNRPDALNSVTPAMFEGLLAALAEAETDPEVRLVALTGAGRAFSAGADLKAIREFGGEADEGTVMARFFAHAAQAFNRLEQFPKPTIAALNGVTLAAGIELALCCDLIFADPRAKIGDGHANYGMLPGGGGSVRLPKRVGPSRARHMLYTGDLYAPDLLERWGLVDEVVPEGALRKRVAEFAAQVATKSPLGLKRMKELVAASGEQAHAAGLLHEVSVAELHVHAFDRNEGLAAFAEKRAPRFEGR